MVAYAMSLAKRYLGVKFSFSFLFFSGAGDSMEDIKYGQGNLLTLTLLFGDKSWNFLRKSASFERDKLTFIL